MEHGFIRSCKKYKKIIGESWEVRLDKNGIGSWGTTYVIWRLCKESNWSCGMININCFEVIGN